MGVFQTLRYPESSPMTGNRRLATGHGPVLRRVLLIRRDAFASNCAFDVGGWNENSLRSVDVDGEGAGMAVSRVIQRDIFMDTDHGIHLAGGRIVTERAVVQFVGVGAGLLPNAQAKILAGRGALTRIQNFRSIVVPLLVA